MFCADGGCLHSVPKPLEIQFKSSMTEPEIVAELFKLYQKKVDELAAAEATEKATKKPHRKKAATPAAEEASSSTAD